MDIDKMRRYAALKTPDTVSRLFDSSLYTENEYSIWVRHFQHQMRVKHGSNMKSVEAHQFDVYGPKHNVMIVLNVKLFKEV